MPEVIEVDTTWTAVVAILVLYLGRFLTRHIRPLREFNIPEAVSGGLICSICLAVLAAAGGYLVEFDMSSRDTLLLVFFSA